MIVRAVVAFARVALKVFAVVLVVLVVLFVIGWLVDVVVDPAEQEITTVES